MIFYCRAYWLYMLIINEILQFRIPHIQNIIVIIIREYMVCILLFIFCSFHTIRSLCRPFVYACFFSYFSYFKSSSLSSEWSKIKLKRKETEEYKTPHKIYVRSTYVTILLFESGLKNALREFYYPNHAVVCMVIFFSFIFDLTSSWFVWENILDYVTRAHTRHTK